MNKKVKSKQSLLKLEMLALKLCKYGITETYPYPVVTYSKQTQAGVVIKFDDGRVFSADRETLKRMK